MKLNKILVSVLTLIALAGSNSASATNPGIGAQFVSQGKSVGKALGSAGKYVFGGGQGFLSKHGRAWHFEAAAAAMIGYAFYNYYGRIQPIKNKYDPEKQGPGVGKLSLWGLKSQWATHVDIVDQQDEFITGLKSAQEVRGDEDQAEIIHMLDQEYAELKTDIAYLEKLFVEYFKLPEWLGGSHGIKRKYHEILRNRNLTNVATSSWTPEDFNNVDHDMQRVCRNSWYHYILFKINYGNAASLWWKLQKLKMRLDVIKHLMTPVHAGRSDVPRARRDLSSTQTRGRSRTDAGLRAKARVRVE